MRREFAGNGEQQLSLRYGMNPHQKPAEISVSPLDAQVRKMPITSMRNSLKYSLIRVISIFTVARVIRIIRVITYSNQRLAGLHQPARCAQWLAAGQRAHRGPALSWSVCLSLCLSICQSICPSICLSLCLQRPPPSSTSRPLAQRLASL